MSLLWLCKITGLGLWLLFVPVWANAIDALDVSHHQTQQACHGCHTERLPVMQQSDKCQSCHARIQEGREQGDASVATLLLAQDGLQAQDQTQGQAGIIAPAVGLPPGMSVSMYYPDSRFGAEPGPMMRIPAGHFMMGSDTRLEDEGPQHLASTEAYRMDLYEVTNLQYQQFIAATQRRSPRHFRNRTFAAGYADHPVTFVSWFDARAYCDWAGKRLPTEIEWEKAARGADGRVYPWGNEFKRQVANTPLRWVELNKVQRSTVSDGDTTPVGAFAAGRSPYGLYDMSGNVWEWVADWYGPHPGNNSPSENYGQTHKVLKGGSWWDCSFYKCGISAPTFNRSFFSPRVRNSSFGFRCGQDDG